MFSTEMSQRLRSDALAHFIFRMYKFRFHINTLIILIFKVQYSYSYVTITIINHINVFKCTNLKFSINLKLNNLKTQTLKF